MDFGISKSQIDLLKQFVFLCKSNPLILNSPSFEFFKDWLVNDLHATIPNATESQSKDEKKPSYSEAAKEKDESSSEEELSEDEEVLEDLEIDMEGVIEGDEDQLQDMGDDNKEITEEDEDQAMMKRSEGMKALSDGDVENAITLFTEGIKLDNSKTVLFVKRATAFNRLQKPNAAIRDAEKALQINPDSAAAFKILGKALKSLGKWDEACRSFEEAQKIDFDDEICELIREVKPKATKIREHKMALERKKKEKEVKTRLRRVQKAQKAQEKAKAAQRQKDQEKMKENIFKFAGSMPQGSGPMPQGTGPQGDFAGSGGDFDFESFMRQAQSQFGKSSATGSASGAASGGSGGGSGEDPKIFEVPDDDLD